MNHPSQDQGQQSASNFFSSCANDARDFLQRFTMNNNRNGQKGGSSPQTHCTTCGSRFTLLKSRKMCPECRQAYCNDCLQRHGKAMVFEEIVPAGSSSNSSRPKVRKQNVQICHGCSLLTSRPLNSDVLMSLPVRNLRRYLYHRGVSDKHCSGEL
ncbi:unnamed protein product [Cyprideis torosa]|uniref:FYVE-type domain-containing protein n=1 Tax=Cyprideis torosa TaxID=163714 RepID=A0A7R8ZRA9_9CRUS|nr:unnamed protein product [Cyprideis torosa]CAG0903243.1 unnamed protein product [Cyprideis torosa]